MFMKCLVTAIGSFSADAVIASLKRSHVSRVIGCDIHPASWIPTSPSVDAFYQVPLASDAALYIDALTDIIRKETVDYIIPLTDPEIDCLSMHRLSIEQHGAKLCIAPDKAVAICRDKLALYEFFKTSPNIRVIPTFEAAQWSPSLCPLPIIAKPRNGRSSEGIFTCDTAEELQVRQRKLHQYVVQPLLKGDIFTVDLIRHNARDKSFAIARKELIRTKNGAGISVEVSCNTPLVTATQYAGKQLGINGCVNMEYIVSGDEYFLMDINPRFSAGIAYSVLAGYDMVMSHINCFNGGNIQDPIAVRTMTIVKALTDVVTRVGEQQW
jgi:carbamoyl-phosphate synthase large subunit